MSDIKAGALVTVVRPTPCCRNASAIGTTFVVQSVVRRQRVRCIHCGTIEIASEAAIGAWIAGEPVAYQLYRLIRIDPPARPESVATDEEITA